LFINIYYFKYTFYSYAGQTNNKILFDDKYF